MNPNCRYVFGEGVVGPQLQSESGTQQQQADGSEERHLPATCAVNQYPKLKGETSPATAKPKFIMPLAVPA